VVFMIAPFTFLQVAIVIPWSSAVPPGDPFLLRLISPLRKP